MLKKKKRTKDGIGCGTHTTLQRQELLGDTSGMQLIHQELGSEVTDAVGHGVAVIEGAGLVGDVALHHAHEFLFRDGYIGLADAVAHLRDGDGKTVRRVEGLIHVVDKLGVGVMERVEFQNHSLGQTGCRGTDATGGSEIGLVEIAGILNVANLEDGPVYVTVETIAQLLCHVAQMKVVVRNLTHVHMLAEIRVGGVGCTILDGLGNSQVAISALSGGGASEDAHLERTSGLMLGCSNFSQFFCHCLCYSRRCKAAERKVLTVFDKRRCLGSSQKCISHIRMLCF